MTLVYPALPNGRVRDSVGRSAGASRRRAAAEIAPRREVVVREQAGDGRVLAQSQALRRDAVGA
ncbi:MAG TPA: hypothetical protein VGO89_16625, partial [Streptomyces sp.]|nr:hypothetical protein [Streptomyces sp.]